MRIITHVFQSGLRLFLFLSKKVAYTIFIKTDVYNLYRYILAIMWPVYNSEALEESR